MTILSARAVQVLILREITAAGGSIDERDLAVTLDVAGIERDRARREIKYLTQTLGRLVRIEDSLRIPTVYRGRDDDLLASEAPAPAGRRRRHTTTRSAR